MPNSFMLSRTHESLGRGAGGEVESGEGEKKRARVIFLMGKGHIVYWNSWARVILFIGIRGFATSRAGGGGRPNNL